MTSKLQAALLLFALLGLSPSSQAQSTDASHALQVLPVVVDSASFTSLLVFRPANQSQVTINARYFPAEGTSQATPVDCTPFVAKLSEPASFNGLRDLCPGLAPGSQFGFLYLSSGNTSTPFTAYARVSNAQGIGFSVEAFPASDFTGGRAVVTGLRRLAASGGSPAYQSNCFIGVLNEVTPEVSPVTTTISFTLYNHFGSPLGSGNVSLTPGKLVRLLDVFAAANAPPANEDNVTAIFEESGDGEPSVITFCTVQDNTSFGADFRIGKQAFGASHGSLVPNPAAQDDGALRESLVESDVALSTGPGTASARNFTIPAGASSNAHVVYFRHPDWISCAVVDPATGVTAAPAYGLETRLMASDGVTVIAGGNDTTGFGLYLGDKRDRDTGVNTRYVIEVESAETNTGANRPYRLQCRSGSGHTLGELIRTGGPNLF